MHCDDASTEHGAPGAAVREMTDAVRTVEPVQGPSFLAPASTNARPLVQPPGLGLGATKALSGQGDKSCAAVHGTQITATSTGADNDAMEVEAVGVTADQRGDEAVRGSEGDVMMEDLVTDKMSATDKSHSEGLMTSETAKKKRRRGAAKKSAGHVGGNNAHLLINVTCSLSPNHET